VTNDNKWMDYRLFHPWTWVGYFRFQNWLT
jgi:hypothetical protein